MKTRFSLPEMSQAEGEEARQGTVVQVLADGICQVELKDGQHILAYPAGKMRLCLPRLVVGDRVLVQTTRYDPRRGRILRRLNGEMR